MSKLSESQWVFSAKEDLFLFGGATLIAFIGGMSLQHLGNYFWMFILFDQPHVFSTYFHTYASDRFSKKFKFSLIMLPIVSFAVSLYFFKGISTEFTYAFLSNFAAFHFTKQQSAWFFISKYKEGPSPVWTRYEKNIDKFAIYSSIWGPLLLSMTNVIGKSGWRRVADLIPIPLWVQWPIYIIWPLSLILYVTLQIKKYRATGKVSWGKHFHLINALLIWFIYRLLYFKQFIVMGQLLIVFGHSFPYLYLGMRYHQSRLSQEKFWPNIKSMKGLFILILASTILLSYVEVLSEDAFFDQGIVPCLWLGLIFTHFLVDTFMWRSNIHPEGLAFLKE